MADLLDRIQHDGVDGRPKIPTHQLIAAIWLFGLGVLTKAQIAAAFDLQGAEATDGNALADLITAQGTVAGKLSVLLKIDAIFLLTEQANELGLFATKAEIRAALGI